MFMVNALQSKNSKIKPATLVFSAKILSDEKIWDEYFESGEFKKEIEEADSEKGIKINDLDIFFKELRDESLKDLYVKYSD